jgi:hypothetical protein
MVGFSCAAWQPGRGGTTEFIRGERHEKAFHLRCRSRTRVLFCGPSQGDASRAPGGVAGSVAGQGKVGAAAGCVIGRHEANKADAQKAAPQTTAPGK